MMRTVACALVFVSIGGAAAIALANDTVPVTPDNFKRAETDMYFRLIESRGALGKFIHHRELPLEGTGVRPNRDTLLGSGV